MCMNLTGDYVHRKLCDVKKKFRQRKLWNKKSGNKFDIRFYKLKFFEDR